MPQKCAEKGGEEGLKEAASVVHAHRPTSSLSLLLLLSCLALLWSPFTPRGGVAVQ